MTNSLKRLALSTIVAIVASVTLLTAWRLSEIPRFRIDRPPKRPAQD